MLPKYRWGNSAAVRLPKEVLEQAGLRKANASTSFRATASSNAKTPSHHQRTFAEAESKAPSNQPEPIDWGPDVGAEIIDDAYSRAEGSRLEDSS